MMIPLISESASIYPRFNCVRGVPFPTDGHEDFNERIWWAARV
jgi:hypothetical protein